MGKEGKFAIKYYKEVKEREKRTVGIEFTQWEEESKEFFRDRGTGGENIDYAEVKAGDREKKVIDGRG